MIVAYPTEYTDAMQPMPFTCGDDARCHDETEPCGCYA